jgi:hypothetical protein
LVALVAGALLISLAAGVILIAVVASHWVKAEIDADAQMARQLVEFTIQGVHAAVPRPGRPSCTTLHRLDAVAGPA